MARNTGRGIVREYLSLNQPTKMRPASNNTQEMSIGLQQCFVEWVEGARGLVPMQLPMLMIET